jgi:hypothetical protein
MFRFSKTMLAAFLAVWALGVGSAFGEDAVRLCRPGDRKLAITFLDEKSFSISMGFLFFDITNVSRVSMSQLHLEVFIYDAVTQRHVVTLDGRTVNLMSGDGFRMQWNVKDGQGAYVRPGLYRFVAYGTFLDSPRLPLAIGPVGGRFGEACGDAVRRLEP